MSYEYFVSLNVYKIYEECLMHTWDTLLGKMVFGVIISYNEYIMSK